MKAFSFRVKHFALQLVAKLLHFAQLFSLAKAPIRAFVLSAPEKRYYDVFTVSRQANSL
jgi:hypothetical protein